MKFTFASLAALSLTATQAARLSKEFTPVHAAPQQLAQKPPQSYNNIMQSVKSLEKAYEYHQNEEKLLNEINGELKDYWNQAAKSNQYVENDQKQEAKVGQKAAVPPKSTAIQTSSKEPADDVHAELDEDVQLDEEDNFLQIEEEDQDQEQENVQEEEDVQPDDEDNIQEEVDVIDD
jgi:hypothetical protein